MSFAWDVRGELARLPLPEICCARSELNAALLSSGGISWRGRAGYAVTLTASDAAAVRRFFSMLKHFWGIVGEIRTLSGDALNGQTRYQLAVPEADSVRLLEELRLLDATQLFGVRQLPDPGIVNFACCKKAFARGAFLMCGAVSHPDREYHIEIAAPTEEFAAFLVEQLDYFEIHARVAPRKAKYVVYLKRAEDISDMLTLLGAGKAMMDFENIRINKELRNTINRQLNCDQSNINRAMAAAEQQIADIRFIDSEMGLDKLPKSLREMAQARMNYPDASLSDLGELLVPPISKSGVNTRLRKIAAVAEKLRTGEEIE